MYSVSTPFSISTLRCAGWPSSSMRERSPLAPVRAVVDQRHQRRRDELTHVAREHRRVLVDVVGLETVAARFVEQHAAGAAAQHHRDLARSARAPRRAASSARVAAVRPTCSGMDGVEQLEAHRAARRLVARLHAGVAGRDALHHHARAHPVVVGEQPVGVGDQDAAVRVGVRSGHRRDRAALLARRRRRRCGATRPCGPSRPSRARPRVAAGRGRRRRLKRDGARVPPPPPRAAAAAASAAASSPSGERSAVCANPVVSPRTTRRPAPRSRPDTSSSTRPSSNRALDDRRSSTNTSAKSPPSRRRGRASLAARLGRSCGSLMFSDRAREMPHGCLS